MGSNSNKQASKDLREEMEGISKHSELLRKQVLQLVCLVIKTRCFVLVGIVGSKLSCVISTDECGMELILSGGVIAVSEPAAKFLLGMFYCCFPTTGSKRIWLCCCVS